MDSTVLSVDGTLVFYAFLSIPSTWYTAKWKFALEKVAYTYKAMLGIKQEIQGDKIYISTIQNFCEELWSKQNCKQVYEESEIWSRILCLLQLPCFLPLHVTATVWRLHTIHPLAQTLHRLPQSPIFVISIPSNYVALKEITHYDIVNYRHLYNRVVHVHTYIYIKVLAIVVPYTLSHYMLTLSEQVCW